MSHSTWDDDFDTDFGWGGNVQFGLVVRNPFFADQSGSNAFESDNQEMEMPLRGFVMTQLQLDVHAEFSRTLRC